MFRNLFLLVMGIASPVMAQSVPIFDDVPSYLGYYSHVNMMRLRFVTTGCTYIPSAYCPNENLTRGQAAVLIIRSIYSGSTGNPEGFYYNPYLPQYFSDVPSSHPLGERLSFSPTGFGGYRFFLAFVCSEVQKR